MFIHTVLFQISPKFVRAYLRDCKMWAKEAKIAPGFISYKTLKRINDKNQFASVYCWKNKRHHFNFMKANHEELVKKSKAKVLVLGYFNFDAIDAVKSDKSDK